MERASFHTSFFICDDGKGGFFMENIKEINKQICDAESIEAWAAWYEGEEGWGSGSDDDDD